MLLFPFVFGLSFGAVRLLLVLRISERLFRPLQKGSLQNSKTYKGFWSFGVTLQNRFWSKGGGFGVGPSLLIILHVGGFGAVLELLPFRVDGRFSHFFLADKLLDHGEK